jgi:hypothetical protein
MLAGQRKSNLLNTKNNYPFPEPHRPFLVKVDTSIKKNLAKANINKPLTKELSQ